MADHYYSITLPAQDPLKDSAVIKGTSSAAGNFELRITDGVTGVSGNKLAVLLGIEAIKAFIERDGAPA